MRVNIFANHPDAPKLGRGRLSALVRSIIENEKKKAESVSVVLVDDAYLLEVNRNFLNHNYRTDVISFDLGEGGEIEGEIYISVDRARVQARRYKVSTEKEIVRLIVHGILHLTGWEDKTRSEKLRMRKRENAFVEPFFTGRDRR